jgi:hypothetical protein
MLRALPAQQFGKPRNPLAALAKARSAGAHAKPLSNERQAAKRQLKKAPLVPEDD